MQRNKHFSKGRLMKKGILVFTVLFSAMGHAANFNGLSSKDDCFAAVVGLSQGIAQSYKVYNNKAAKILSVELSSATETREYSLHLSHDGSYDSYRIELSNDSATKCIMNQIFPVEIGG